MDKEKWREQFAAWLEDFQWKWFCTLTYRPGLRESQCRLRLRGWIATLRDTLGTAEFGFIAVPESGQTGLDFHFHVLVMGLREWHARPRLYFMRRWYKLAGDARITEFTPNSGGVRYILKTVGPNDMDTIEFELSSRPTQQTKVSAK